jgi:multicomponent Na+:H+ antiporter subunit B
MSVVPHETPTEYRESPVIVTVARLLGPFVLTFGVFVTLHGATSPGGGFQGGVVVAAAVVLLAFAYGIESVRAWLAGPTVGRLVTGGIGLFLLVALGSVVLGGSLLEYGRYGIDPKYAGELVEVGIGLTVTGVLVALFVLLAGGFEDGSPATAPATDPADATETEEGSR